MLRSKFLGPDYSIVDDVLKTQLEKRPKPDGPTKVSGMPLKVVSQAVLDLLANCDDTFDEICVEWKEVCISGIPSNVEVADKEERLILLRDEFLPLAAFAGGVVQYVAAETWENEDGICITITESPKAFLCPKNVDDLLENGRITTCTGNSHKINFDVVAKSKGAIIDKDEYCWLIDPYDSWAVAFKELFKMPDDGCYIPASTTKELNAAFALKDSDAFAWWITHESIEHLNRENDVFDYFKRFLSHVEEKAWIPTLMKLGKAFQELRADITHNGFYAAIDGSLNHLIDEYISVAKKLSDPNNRVFSNKLIKLTSCFVRWFTLCDVKERFIENVRVDQVIVPP